MFYLLLEIVWIIYEQKFITGSEDAADFPLSGITGQWKGHEQIKAFLSATSQVVNTNLSTWNFKF